MWCTEVAADALLVLRIVVSGDIGDHWRYLSRVHRMRQRIIRTLSCILLLTIIAGCGNTEVNSPKKTADIASRLRITTWDVDSLVGKTVRIEAKGESDGAIEFLVEADTVLATQVASVHHAITVFVLDDTGVGSTYISIGNRIDGLRSGALAKGVLYEYNNEPVITLTEIGNSSNNGMDAKGSISRFGLR
jgi:hypothetical protein